MDPLVKLENVSVIYNEGQGVKELTALKDITLEIYPQEFVIFFGPSGCGKSTLLNVVAGLERISRGRVLVGGQDIAHLTDEEMATYHRHQMGFIFQAYNLIPTLTVGENIALPQMFEGVARGDYIKRAMELAVRFGIAEHTGKIPSELSGGQQQRVGIARAIVNNPSLILADEPTGNLDSKNVRLVLDVFQEFNLKEKRTIIYVTHSPSHLSEVDRVFYIKDGRIVNEVRNKERIINKNIGENQENPIVKEVREEHEKQIKAAEEVPEEIRVGAPTISELLEQPAEPHSGFTAEKITEYAMAIPREQVMQRIREVVEEHIRGVTTAYQMVKKLDAPYLEGGAGMNKRSAQKMGEMTEHLIANAGIVRRLEAMAQDTISDTVAYVAESLAVALRLSVPSASRPNLEKLLGERFLNQIGPVKLRRMLDEKIERQGAGLHFAQARKLSGYVELIILIAHHMQEQKVNQYRVVA